MEPLEGQSQPLEIRIPALHSFSQRLGKDMIADIGLLKDAALSLFEFSNYHLHIFGSMEDARRNLYARNSAIKRLIVAEQIDRCFVLLLLRLEHTLIVILGLKVLIDEFLALEVKDGFALFCLDGGRFFVLGLFIAHFLEVGHDLNEFLEGPVAEVVSAWLGVD